MTLLQERAHFVSKLMMEAKLTLVDHFKLLVLQPLLKLFE